MFIESKYVWLRIINFRLQISRNIFLAFFVIGSG